MKPRLHRCLAASLHWIGDLTVQRFNGFTFRHAFVICLLIFPLAVGAQFSPSDSQATRSVSGQFIVIGPAQLSRLAGSPAVAADTNLVRLDPALLVVSAERTKDSLYHRFDLKSGAPWRGRIYLALHPAQSLDETVTIVSQISANGGDYRVELPDVLTRRRFTRAMTGVILLEFANRTAWSHPAEIPAWLTDGLAEGLLAKGSSETILSAPTKVVNGLLVARINTTQHGIDPLAQARRVLQKFPPLTFEDLSWPTAAQMTGNDGGAYRASAQVFVDALLALKHGPSHLRTFLGSLPRFYNWQTAFQSAFHEMFPRPLDLEKWWALQLVSFAAHDAGPTWTPAVSRAKLDELLSIPVEMRGASNSLPERAEISLQTVIRSLDSERQSEILEVKLRDLGLAQFRMAPSLAALTDEYRRALAAYLGESLTMSAAPAWSKHASAPPKKASVAKTLKKLDELDARRRIIEANIKPDKSIQPSLAPLKF